MTIFAAGTVCWRVENKEFKVLLVHREKYRDWGFPKGKLDPGECLPVTAVRETREEAGLKVKLGRKIAQISYPLPNGQDKEVHYWAAQVSDKALAKSNFKPNKEIASVEWVTVAQARALLSYEHDHDILAKTLEYLNSKKLDTKTLILLRHAQALPRSQWEDTDGQRPLTGIGTLQSRELAPILAAFSPSRVVTSPWKRCLDTVKPYGKKRRLKIVESSVLSEAGNKFSPKQTARLIKEITEWDWSVVICTHRPALPTVVEALSKFANGNEDALAQGLRLKPAGFLVLRLDRKNRMVLDVEHHSIEDLVTQNVQ